MIKDVLKNKLSDSKGASLVMALFLLIVVIVVSIIILNAALSNVGRVKRNMRAEQNYLTVSSGTKLVKDYMGDVTAEYKTVETTVEKGTPTSDKSFSFRNSALSSSSDTNPFRSLIETWLTEGKYSTDTDMNYTLAIDSKSNSGNPLMDTVYAQMSIMSAQKDNDSTGDDTDEETVLKGEIVIDFSLHENAKKTGGNSSTDSDDIDEASDDYLMTMTIPYTLVIDINSVTTENGTGKTKTTTTTTTTTKKFSTASASGSDNNIIIKKGRSQD